MMEERTRSGSGAMRSTEESPAMFGQERASRNTRPPSVNAEQFVSGH